MDKGFRNQQIAVFLELANDWSPLGKLLDVSRGPGIGREFLSLCSRFTDVAMVNVERQDTVQFDGVHVRQFAADGSDLPFESGPFDCIFSSTIIDNLAIEILRIAAKGHFVACSNKYFPIEPNTLLPLHRFLLRSLQRKVAPHSPERRGRLEEINELRAAQFQSLFPDEGVCTLGPFPLGINTVAYYRRENGMA